VRFLPSLQSVGRCLSPFSLWFQQMLMMIAAESHFVRLICIRPSDSELCYVISCSHRTKPSSRVADKPDMPLAIQRQYRVTTCPENWRTQKIHGIIDWSGTSHRFDEKSQKGLGHVCVPENCISWTLDWHLSGTVVGLEPVKWFWRYYSVTANSNE